MLARALLASPVVYQRRRPEGTTLYRAVHDHLPAFLAAADEADRSVPKFVRREFEAFLDCGLVEKGAIRARCPTCGFDRLVAFSCKSRSGLCGSCSARRMVEIATHLCEHVIPDVPVRQWVLTVPPPMRYLLAYQTDLLARVTRIFVRGIFDHLRRVALRELDLAKDTRLLSGAICVPQRFNSALALSPHLHVIAADGVWLQTAPDVRPSFHALPEPCKGELAVVAGSTCVHTVRYLKRRGMWFDTTDHEDRLAHDEPFLATLATASISGVLAMGPHAGQRPMRLFGRAALSEEEREQQQQRPGKAPPNGYGFDLHAGIRVPAHDRKGRERLCGYLLRPPLSNDRLTRTTDGKYRIAFKRIWDDGTAAMVVSGEELLARLAVLVPPPRIHTIRYFGVFAPRSKLRRLIVPVSPLKPLAREKDQDKGGHHCDQHAYRYRLTWAQALSRVFELDVTRCPRCKQQGMQQIAVLHDARVIRAMLASVERENEPP